MSSKVDYVFTRDFLDNNRINLMHSLWTRVFGYVVHPKIPLGQPDLRVADVGSGTGIWLFDAREQVADSAQLVGLDISFDAAPPKDVLPSNVTFRHWDVNNELPSDLVGSFDIVHVRFLSFVLQNDQVQGAVEKLFKMLKPGGYLQWGEPDIETLRFDKIESQCTTHSLEQLYKLFEIQDARLKPTWAGNLHHVLAAAGFIDVGVDRIDASPHWAYIFHEGALMMHEILSRKMNNERMKQELTRLLPLAVEETRKGAWVTSVRLTIVGKKPEGH